MRLGVRRALVYAEHALRERAMMQLFRIEAACAPYSRYLQQRIEELRSVALGYNEPGSSDPDAAWKTLRSRKGLN